MTIHLICLCGKERLSDSHVTKLKSFGSMDWIIPTAAGFIAGSLVDGLCYEFITQLVATTNATSESQTLTCYAVLLVLWAISFVGTFATVRLFFDSN